MKGIISAFIIGFVFMGFAHKAPADKMDSFKWLVGTWAMETKDGKILETWLPMNDSSYSGETTLLKKTTETVPLERIRLVARGKEFYYIATAAGQNENSPVEFKLSAYNKTKFVAENPDHDFPKRITYWLIKKDSLHAFIDGGASKPNQRTDYYYSRVKKATAPKADKKN